MFNNDFDVHSRSTTGQVTIFRNVKLDYINKEIIGRLKHIVLEINPAKIPVRHIFEDSVLWSKSVTNG